jgi:hypothetical protein
MCQLRKHGDNSIIKTKTLSHLPSEQQSTDKCGEIQFGQLKRQNIQAIIMTFLEAGPK